MRVIKVKVRVRETIMVNATQNPNPNHKPKYRQIRVLEIVAARNKRRKKITHPGHTNKESYVTS